MSQSEFQCDPFQDRPAEKGGQEWVEFIVCAPLRLRFSQHAGGVSSLRSEYRVFATVRFADHEHGTALQGLRKA